MNTQIQQRFELRKRLRCARRSLSKAQQALAAREVLKHLLASPLFLYARHIALYIPNDGEISTQCIAHWCRAHGKQLYLPVLHPVHQRLLWFLPWQHDALKHNRFGILEPDIRRFPIHKKHPQAFSAWRLDTVLLPLVGFDPQGNRLGMGGGFYDRTFAFMQKPHPMRCPRLIGLAHTCQQVAALSSSRWDIPMHAIATDQGLLFPQSLRSNVK